MRVSEPDQADATGPFGDSTLSSASISALEAFASGSGLIPEQIWDTADLPTHELFFGRSQTRSIWLTAPPTDG